MSKKYKKQRRTWEIDPITRVVPNEKKYDRNKFKDELKEELEIIEEE